MAPKLANSKRSRPRAPGVKAGLELMVQLGGIQVLGTSQQPYYYFPPAIRTARGIERCTRCVDACGSNAACNVQPYTRVGTNLWKARKCHYCTIFPAELEGDRCTLEDRFYRYNAAERRLMPSTEAGEVLTDSQEDSDVEDKVHSHRTVIAAPITPPPEKEDVALVPSVPQPTTPKLESLPEPVTPPTAHMSSFGLYTPAATPSQEKSEKKSRERESQSPPQPQVLETQETPSSIPALQPIEVTAPAVAPAVSPAPTPATVPEPVAAIPAATPTPPAPSTAIPSTASVLKSNIRRSVALAPVWSTKPAFDREVPPTPSLANFAPPTPTAASPSTTLSGTHTSATPAALPVPVKSEYTPTPTTSSFTIDPLSRLVATRRPATVLSAVGDALTTELANLDDISASIAELRRLLAIKEEEQAAQMRKVESYRNAIDDALNSIEEEQKSLRSMRARLAGALAYVE